MRNTSIFPLLIIVIALILGAIQACDRQNKVENVEPTVETGKYKVVFFTSPWCSTCADTIRAWDAELQTLAVDKKEQITTEILVTSKDNAEDPATEDTVQQYKTALGLPHKEASIPGPGRPIGSI